MTGSADQGKALFFQTVYRFHGLIELHELDQFCSSFGDAAGGGAQWGEPVSEDVGDAEVGAGSQDRSDVVGILHPIEVEEADFCSSQRPDAFGKGNRTQLFGEQADPFMVHRVGDPVEIFAGDTVVRFFLLCAPFEEGGKNFNI